MNNFLISKLIKRRINFQLSNFNEKKYTIRVNKVLGSKNENKILSIFPDEEDIESKIELSLIYSNVKLFNQLNLKQQQNVRKQLDLKFEKDWNLLKNEEKILGYYIYYGNWGPRKGFDDWNQLTGSSNVIFGTQNINRKELEKKRLFNIFKKIDKKNNFQKKDTLTKIIIFIGFLTSILGICKTKQDFIKIKENKNNQN